MSDFHLDTRQVRRAFARAVASYEQHDVVQREVQQQLLSRLDFYLDTPARVLDIGAATGRGAALLKRRYPKATVIALDAVMPMLRQARRHQRLLRPFARVAGAALRLPIADRSIDVVHSNLCLPWCDNLQAWFGDCARVLRPGGFLVFSTLGPDTLSELRAAWAGHDAAPHVGLFLDMHDVGDAMIMAGLYDPVLDVSRITLTYADPQGLLRELKGLGATNADAARRRGLTGRHAYEAMLAAYAERRVDGRIPATVEVVTAHAWSPQPGTRLRLPIGVGVSAP